jgi:GrpB-like predicted nucleotidyltransferase (UPF0157 family)
MTTQRKRQAMRLQLRDALNQLEANPTAFHGVITGWKRQVTQARKWLEANPSASQAILRANVTGKIESGNGVAIVERGEA